MRNRYHRGIARPSHIRPGIEELFARTSRHDWSIDEVAAGLHEAGVEGDFSSVFRALGQLESEGLIQRIELGDGKARFEPAGDHHEHVRCESCGVVAAVPGCLVKGAVPAVERHTGFKVSGHRLLFSGRCRSCESTGG